MSADSSVVTKQLFLNGTICPPLGWFSARQPPEGPPSPGDLFLMQEGKAVHQRARSLFPDGQFAGTREKTQRLLDDKNNHVIFEAAFETDGYAARADAIQRLKSGFRLIEIKSSLFNENSVEAEHIDDLAYTTMVLERAGIKVAKAELVLLSRDWRIGMPDQRLFVIADHTKAVRGRAEEFDSQWVQVRNAVSGPKRPKPQLLMACGQCTYFENQCLGKGVEDPIFDLPRLSDKVFDELAEVGSLSIHDIPASVRLSAVQQRVREAVVSGKPVVDQNQLRSLLKEVRWPAMYLDFETVKTALPLWPDVAPHEQVLTQYSLHRCDSLGKVTSHSECLADSSRDCRLELAERLLADTEGTGSVIHYHTFEKTMISGLAKKFPQLAKRLQALVDRLFDMERFFSNAYCHPGFRGRTSIKATLPVVVQGMSYETLEIGEGGAAMAAFAGMARGECSPEETSRLRTALLAYCRQDTLAMVRLHEAMAKLAQEPSR